MAVKRNILGPRIRKLRKQKGMTQEMLAARCSVLGLEMSRALLSKIEAQIRQVTDSDLLVMAEALKVDVKDLFAGIKRPTKHRT